MVGTLTFSFVACGDDDEEEIKTTINEAGIDVSLLYGKWSFTNQGIVMIEMTLKKMVQALLVVMFLRVPIR